MKNLFKHTASQLIIVVPNTTPIVVPVIAPVVAPNRTTPVVLLLFTTLLFLVGCKPKQIITEKVVTTIDSTADYFGA